MPSTILIVDDEPHVLRVTELSLRRGGYDIVIGRNGREALDLARLRQPELIVMDVLMPEMDGLAALRELKNDPATAGIPVILLSARGHIILPEEAGSCGAALFLTKPFSPTQLLSEARRLILENSEAPASLGHGASLSHP
ncbi:MAG: response regulator [Verrucomicrobiales bacterium]|nr:response regulator [Verrucomicrobiales bacterium]